MSETTKDDEMFLATIRRMNAETGKFIEDQSKLAAEQRKLLAEADKFSREKLTLVISATATLTLAAAAVGGVMVKFLGG